MRVLLRSVAVLIAILAVIDPVVARNGRRPLPIEIRLPPPSHPDHGRAGAVRHTVVAALDGLVEIDAAEPPKALVIVGDVRGHANPALPAFVLPIPDRAPVLIREFVVPAESASGLQTEVFASVEARDGGHTTAFQLLVNGIPLASARHVWPKGAADHDVRFSLPALGEGVHRLRLIARTDGAETAADAAIAIRSRQLRILVYEPRPSWPLTFARRALEGQALFEVASVARTSHRVSTVAGDAQDALAPGRLHAFDAALVGAPDALTDPQLAALTTFVRERGGTVILLPDRRLPDRIAQRFGLPETPDIEEALLEERVSIQARDLRLYASELLLVREAQFVNVLGTAEHAGSARPVVVSAPLGHGTVVFSGALDAWRYRADEHQAFGRVVRALAADGALSAPPPVDVSVTPSVARPGDPVSVQVAVRPTEFVSRRGETRVPAVTAALIDSAGQREMVRVWPTSIPGIFEGVVTPAREGRFALSVRVGNDAADAVLSVASDIVHATGPRPTDSAIANLTGGAAVRSIDELRQRIERMEPTTMAERMRPMRSPWWIVPFVALLSAEWVIRRRSGLR